MTSAQPPTPSIRRFIVGDLELVSLCAGFCRVDGGAIFGGVPKTLWERRAPADDRNRVLQAIRPLVVRGARTMLVDAGTGEEGLEEALAAAGVAVDDIDIVLATHLHVDHAGGFTTRDAGGRLRPAFPRAQYIVRRGEWEDATHPHERSRASYLADNYMPLADAGVLQLVDEDATIMPGVKVRRTGGHTMHHQIVLIESGGRAAAFMGDVMPTAAHVDDAWIMGCDLYPMDTLAAKKRFAVEAIERGMLVLFEHDPSIAAGYIREEKGQRVVQPA